jgi:hypothetical protein
MNPSKRSGAFKRPTNGFDESPEPIGPEGRQLYLKADEAFAHRDERAEILMLIDSIISGSELDEAEDWSYVAVPPTRTFHVRTRYVYRGKAKPLPYRLEDE